MEYPAVASEGEFYLGWFDDDPKRTVEQKLRDACERFEQKFGSRPTVALLHREVEVSVPGIEVRKPEYIRPNHIWVGKG